MLSKRKHKRECLLKVKKAPKRKKASKFLSIKDWADTLDTSDKGSNFERRSCCMEEKKSSEENRTASARGLKISEKASEGSK